MTPFTISTRKFVAVSVPYGASDIAVSQSGNLDYLYEFGMTYITLPPGTWSIVADSASVTEEQAERMVQSDDSDTTVNGILQAVLTYMDYECETRSCYDAVESFHSLLRSLSITGRVVVLENTQK